MLGQIISASGSFSISLSLSLCRHVIVSLRNDNHVEILHTTAFSSPSPLPQLGQSIPGGGSGITDPALSIGGFDLHLPTSPRKGFSHEPSVRLPPAARLDSQLHLSHRTKSASTRAFGDSVQGAVQCHARHYTLERGQHPPWQLNKSWRMPYRAIRHPQHPWSMPRPSLRQT